MFLVPRAFPMKPISAMEGLPQDISFRMINYNMINVSLIICYNYECLICIIIIIIVIDC